MYPQQGTLNPFLEAAVENNYGNFESRGGHFYSDYPSNYKLPYPPYDPAESDPDDIFTGSSSYGYEPSDSYDQHYPPVYPNHPPEEDYSYHSMGPSSSGYASYGHPHVPSTSSSFGLGKLKRGGNSAITALTLLAFFFFLNLLQTCLKEHTATINPTVMVLTGGGVRNRNSKLAEMNSREHGKSQAAPASDGHIVVQPEDLISAAASFTTATKTPAISLKNPYESDTHPSSIPAVDNLQHVQISSIKGVQHSHSNSESRPTRPTELYDSHYDYRNFSDDYEPPRYQAVNPYTAPNHQFYPASFDENAWSFDRHSDTSSSHRRPNFPHSLHSSSWSTGDRDGDRNYFDRDQHGDSYYTRIH